MRPNAQSCCLYRLQVASRCYLYRIGSIARPVRKTSSIFYRFKVGEEALAYPLALAICRGLSKRGAVDFDSVVPIPLSPDRADRGEIKRTKLLARERERLLGIRVTELLSLNRPISKHRIRTTGGFSGAHFEARYLQALGPLASVALSSAQVTAILNPTPGIRGEFTLHS